MDMRSVVLAVGLLGVTGCVRASEGLVREQAAAAFACADYALNVEEVGPDEYRASGCGQALIYSCHRPWGVEGQVPGQPAAPDEEAAEVGNAGPEHAQVCTRVPE